MGADLTMDSDDFNIERALEAVSALEKVLRRRTHKVQYLGREYLVPGTLGDALRLPEITVQLQSPRTLRRERGLEAFQALWDTLSEPTCHATLKEMDWYDPRNLDWDDQRSNRQPSPKN